MRAAACIPVLEMLHTPNDTLRSRAEKVIAALAGLPLNAGVGDGRAQIGGGALPRSIVPSMTLDISHKTLKPQESRHAIAGTCRAGRRIY